MGRRSHGRRSYPAGMPSGQGGFTIRGNRRYVEESLVIEAGLARALDEHPDEPQGDTLRVQVQPLLDAADRLSAREGPYAARELLLREVRQYTRWLRAVDLGLADTGAGRGAAPPYRTAPVPRGGGLGPGQDAAWYGSSSISTGTCCCAIWSSAYRATPRRNAASGTTSRSSICATCRSSPRRWCLPEFLPDHRRRKPRPVWSHFRPGLRCGWSGSISTGRSRCRSSRTWRRRSCTRP